MYVGYLDGIAERSFYDAKDAETWCRLYDGDKTPSYEIVCDYCYHVIKDTPVQCDGMHFCNQECQELMLESLEWENQCEGRLG